MDKNIQDRVQQMIDVLCNKNKSEFTRRIGKPATAVKDIIGGKRTAPGYDFIYAVLSSDLNINPAWLILGEGDMICENSQTKEEKETTPLVDVHKNTIFIGNWEKLGDIVEKAVAAAMVGK